MAKCPLCYWEHGSHDPACPEVAEDKVKAIFDRFNGYRTGRSGEDLIPGETPAFKLGWRYGVIALEEAEN